MDVEAQIFKMFHKYPHFLEAHGLHMFIKVMLHHSSFVPESSATPALSNKAVLGVSGPTWNAANPNRARDLTWDMQAQRVGQEKAEQPWSIQRLFFKEVEKKWS